jgi:hypothetical protein
MRRVDSSHPDRLEYRIESEVKGDLARGIIAIGAFAYLGVVSARLEGKALPVSAIVLWILAVLACLVFIFKRTHLDFDRSRMSLIRRRSVFGLPLGSSVRDMKGIFSVHVSSRLIQPSKRPEYVLFCIGLNDGQSDAIHVVDTRHETVARSCAAEIAQFLNIPVMDTTAGDTVVTPPANTRPLHTRPAAPPVFADIAAPPPGMLSMTQADGNNVRVSLPAEINPYVASPVGLGILMLLAALFFLPGLSTVLRGDMAGLSFMAFGAGLACWPVLDVIRSRKRVDIFAARPRFSVTVSTPLSSRADEILPAEIQDIRVESGQLPGRQRTPFFRARETWETERLVVISPGKIIRFGDGLARHELEWLRAVLLKAVTSN